MTIMNRQAAALAEKMCAGWRSTARRLRVHGNGVEREPSPKEADRGEWLERQKKAFAAQVIAANVSACVGGYGNGSLPKIQPSQIYGTVEG